MRTAMPHGLPDELEELNAGWRRALGSFETMNQLSPYEVLQRELLEGLETLRRLPASQPYAIRWRKDLCSDLAAKIARFYDLPDQDLREAVDEAGGKPIVLAHAIGLVSLRLNQPDCFRKGAVYQSPFPVTITGRWYTCSKDPPVRPIYVAPSPDELENLERTRPLVRPVEDLPRHSRAVWAWGAVFRAADAFALGKPSDRGDYNRDPLKKARLKQKPLGPGGIHEDEELDDHVDRWSSLSTDEVALGWDPPVDFVPDPAEVICARIDAERQGANRSDAERQLVALQSALEKLGPAQRQAVELVDLQGHSPAAAAEQEGIPAATFYKRLHDGHARLRTLLASGM